MVTACPECRTPVGLSGCRRRRERPIPMPDYVRQTMIALGLRQAEDTTQETDR